MKKVILGLGLFAATTFIACNSNDDTTPETNKLVGSWQASKLKYTIPTGQTMEHDFSAIKQGCAVDIITIATNNTAVLTEETKADAASPCTEQTINGTWSDEKITFGESERTIVSVDDTTLVLRYNFQYGTYTTDIDVTYAKK